MPTHDVPVEIGGLSSNGVNYKVHVWPEHIFMVDHTSPHERCRCTGCNDLALVDAVSGIARFRLCRRHAEFLLERGFVETNVPSTVPGGHSTLKEALILWTESAPLGTAWDPDKVRSFVEEALWLRRALILYDGKRLVDYTRSTNRLPGVLTRMAADLGVDRSLLGASASIGKCVDLINCKVDKLEMGISSWRRNDLVRQIGVKRRVLKGSAGVEKAESSPRTNLVMSSLKSFENRTPKGSAVKVFVRGDALRYFDHHNENDSLARRAVTFHEEALGVAGHYCMPCEVRVLPLVFEVTSYRDDCALSMRYHYLVAGHYNTLGPSDSYGVWICKEINLKEPVITASGPTLKEAHSVAYQRWFELHMAVRQAMEPHELPKEDPLTREDLVR